jgi:Phage tail assembly chaperone protein
MTKFHLYYDPVSGEIAGFDNGSFAVERPGLVTVIAELDSLPDPRIEKVDVSTLFVIPKTEAEIREFDRPTKFDVDAAVYDALKKSDEFVLPDYPMTQQQRDAWVIYRQTLRDISKGDPRPNAAEMIAAWPLDPMGNDAIAQLRNRENNDRL